MTGSDVRAYLLTGGGYYFKDGLRLRHKSRHLQMIYPLEGSKMKGVVTLVAKKSGGKYAFRLLSVDLPEGVVIQPKSAAAAAVDAVNGQPSSSASVAAGGASAAAAAPTAGTMGRRPGAKKVDPDSIARIYVIGDPVSYQQFKLLAELREPLLYALQQQGEFFRVEDELEEDLGHYTCPEEDQDQVTVWDKIKAGGRWGAVKAQQLQREAGSWYREQQLKWEQARIRREAEQEKQRQLQQKQEAGEKQQQRQQQMEQDKQVVVAEVKGEPARTVVSAPGERQQA